MSILVSLILSVLASVASPQVSALPEGSALAPDRTPIPMGTIPLKCLTKAMVSYCIPNTVKYQVCSPTVKQVQCPINSYCRETTNAKGENVAYCKYIS
jgi:hypothetical protein